jgi:hypothetical protein
VAQFAALDGGNTVLGNLNDLLSALNDAGLLD